MLTKCMRKINNVYKIRTVEIEKSEDEEMRSIERKEIFKNS